MRWLRWRTVALTASVTLILLAGCGPGPDGASPGPSSAVVPTPSHSVSASSAPPSAAGTPASVVEVVDGDTLVVRVAGRTERVRLIGINAPEHGECYAQEATDALRQLVDHGQVELVTDTSDRDAYDRLLRYVVTDQGSVNVRLVERGAALARRYPPDTARAEELEAAQERARAAGAGMWGPGGCQATDAPPGLALRLHADAPGDDNRNLNGEWVEVRNDGPASVDLSGWGLKDESASHRYTFPQGTVLAAGGTLKVHSGCGADTDTDRYWCEQGSAVWNNSGDTAFLLDPDGAIVTTVSS